MDGVKGVRTVSNSLKTRKYYENRIAFLEEENKNLLNLIEEYRQERQIQSLSAKEQAERERYREEFIEKGLIIG